jgi:hypothetical protein
MVESTAKVNLMYRRFIFKVRVSKKSNGRKSVHTQINYNVPELEPKYSKHIDKRKQIETQESEIECMRTIQSVLSSRQANC